MAKGVFIQDGKTIDFTNNGSPISYREVVPLVTRIGIAGESIATGQSGSVNVVGVFELPAVNNIAFAVGDSLYWDSTSGNLTKTASETIPAGWATESKATADAIARVKIG